LAGLAPGDQIARDRALQRCHGHCMLIPSSPRVPPVTAAPGVSPDPDTEGPAVMAVAATSRSCAPTSIPDEASPAHRRACARAVSRSNGNGGNATSTASTNASRRARCPGVARCTPCSSSDAVMAAMPTSSVGPSCSSRRLLASFIAPGAGRRRMVRSSSMKTVVSRSVPMDFPEQARLRRGRPPYPRRIQDREALRWPAGPVPLAEAFRGEPGERSQHDRQGER
jgi:hypothetical protein